MKKILMTGSTGFIGSNVLSYIKNREDYVIDCPSRKELDTKDENQVVKYLEKGKYDVILHFASPTPLKNSNDSFETLVEDSLRMFLNFYNHSTLFGKMIYTGSGAEYGKHKDINGIKEENCFDCVPLDAYGISKMMINSLAQKSDNIYNFRIFACYGPSDHESKFITHCIRSVIDNKDVTIRKDCLFDYIHVHDFARYIEWGIDNDLAFHNYNVTSGNEYSLIEIAKMVVALMDSKVSVKLLSDEKNYNYTADNSRIVNESHIVPDYSLKDGIKHQIQWEKENYINEKTSS